MKTAFVSKVIKWCFLIRIHTRVQLPYGVINVKLTSTLQGFISIVQIAKKIFANHASIKIEDLTCERVLILNHKIEMI